MAAEKAILRADLMVAMLVAERAVKMVVEWVASTVDQWAV